jgi:uncharacterized protein (DUF2126 family)
VNDDVVRFADAVEARLEAEGLVLTMGGEPTYIPAQPVAPEWNREALGPEKLGYARRLASRLLAKRYRGGVVMQVFGKQYPGEPLPRWVVLALHRDDGVPLWSHPEMLLLDDVRGPNTDADGLRLMEAIAGELGFGAQVLPCIEEEGTAGSPRGWVLPLDQKEGRWVSGAWPYSASSPVVLAPGKSPIGLRLPLGELGDRHLRRAFTVEVTDGGLHLFIPPLEFEAFEALLRLIERVSADLDARGLVICGYRPEGAKGVTSLGLAADPGVLEVNLPPTRRWRDYDEVLQSVTREAAREGLHTTRLHLNGQVQGTGGGAHVLFGGPSVDENPFFDRPDLLASMIRYWQRHPALSYVFSGQYVGPGSQAPRADETLLGKLYELETACFGVDALKAPPDRDFLDRLFRNLMNDSGGNTHRSEICLDKLWNFDSPAGLQGLIELRAFETLPDVNLQSLAALFVRAVLAMLALEPRRGSLVRHGPRLYDAFMLPTLLREDVAEICRDLQAAGLDFDPRWFGPLFEQRFPILGRLAAGNGEVLVRQALEPWPLLAEIADGGTTSRVVDNSTDRIEISVSDPAALAGVRIVVNGVRLALRDVADVRVAGVRYKSADGWPAFHPHIPVQAPIQIALVDAMDSVIAASRYYFWNPDRPVYESRPADLEEALGRQRARWRSSDALRGTKLIAVDPVYAEESTYTLDLRRQAGAVGGFG